MRLGPGGGAPTFGTRHRRVPAEMTWQAKAPAPLWQVKEPAPRASDRMKSSPLYMALRFYNTLSQQVEDFTPASQNTVRMYTCGPTVYDFAHIGNFRTFTFVDLLRKCLRANGFQLNHVMNITDVDDKIIRNAVANHQTLDEYTKIYTEAFLEDCAAFPPEPPERLAPPTKHTKKMAAVIQQLGESQH